VVLSAIWIGPDVSGGGLIAVLFVMGQLTAAVAQLAEFAGKSAEMATSGRRMGPYWDGHALPEPTRERVDELAAQSVSFAYVPSRPVLQDVSLSVRRGELVALTAATGAGKTTLALVLSGLLEPDAGRVMIDGDAALSPRDVAAGRILYVGPKPVLVAGGAAENVLAKDADPAAVQKHLDWFFEGLPVDYADLRIDANGHGVSSGQGQLLQIARASFRDPDVVLFDEATGHLDMPTEALAQEKLMAWCRRRGTLVISHRICPWTEHADRRATV
jgi:ATP-binding cassette subfamily B protein